MKHTLSVAGAALVLSALFLVLASPLSVRSASAPGVPAQQSVATTTQVGPQANVTLFAANGACSSRIIRTQDKDIYLLFADPVNGDVASTSLSGVVGFTQGASTTVAYDAAIYGCGRMTAEASASTTITTAQFF